MKNINYITNQDYGVNNKVHDYLNENWQILYNKDKFMDHERRNLNIWSHNDNYIDNKYSENIKNKGFLQHRRFIDKKKECKKNFNQEMKICKPICNKQPKCLGVIPYKTELYTYKDKEIGVKTCKNPFNRQKVIIKTCRNKCNGEQSVKKKIIKCDGTKDIYYKKIKANGQKYRWYKIDND